MGQSLPSLMFSVQEAQQLVFFFEGTSYINSSVDVKCLDVLFNNIIEVTMATKPHGRPWKGRNFIFLLMMQQLIEACSPKHGCVLDLY
jgi:hypothetical protein